MNPNEIHYIEAKIRFPTGKTKILKFTGERSFIYNTIMWYSTNGCNIKIRERWN